MTTEEINEKKELLRATLNVAHRTEDAIEELKNELFYHDNEEDVTIEELGKEFDHDFILDEVSMDIANVLSNLEEIFEDYGGKYDDIWKHEGKERW